MAFYDGTKLLSLMDLTGDKPEIYLCTTNRSAGKTTFYNRYCLRRFINYGEKFMLLYRFEYEVTDVADKFFRDIERLFFSGHAMASKSRGKGAYQELFYDGKSCGYAVAINSAEKIKKLSHFFSDTARILMDEFQSESNRYVPNEITKFQSVHTSVARGGGKHVRYVPVIMLSNAVSLLNPYYTALGVTDRLKSDTAYLKGVGWVLEQGICESASVAQSETAFNRAFATSAYQMYSSQNLYLNDNTAFIERLDGTSRYLATIKYAGDCFAVREFAQAGIIYVDGKSVDRSFPLRLAVTVDDHSANFVMLYHYRGLIDALRYLFEKGAFRFSSLKAKEAALKTLSY